MKTPHSKRIFLDHLQKLPIVQVACEKSGIGRATIYRWRKESKKFKKDMEEALTEGEALINDMSESQLVSLIRDKNYHAISFWLRHRHQKFRDRMEVTAKLERSEELSPDQKKIVREALRLASLNNPNVNPQAYGDRKDP